MSFPGLSPLVPPGCCLSFLSTPWFFRFLWDQRFKSPCIRNYVSRFTNSFSFSTNSFGKPMSRSCLKCLSALTRRFRWLMLVTWVIRRRSQEILFTFAPTSYGGNRKLQIGTVPNERLIPEGERRVHNHHGHVQRTSTPRRSPPDMYRSLMASI